MNNTHARHCVVYWRTFFPACLSTMAPSLSLPGLAMVWHLTSCDSYSTLRSSCTWREKMTAMRRILPHHSLSEWLAWSFFWPNLNGQRGHLTRDMFKYSFNGIASQRLFTRRTLNKNLHHRAKKVTKLLEVTVTKAEMPQGVGWVNQ